MKTIISTAVLILTLFILPTEQVSFAQAKSPPETRNAALRYWQAFAELKDPPATEEVQVAMEKTLSGEMEWDEAKLGGIVAANEIALGIMQRATKLPDCDWGVEYSRGPEASMAFVPRAHVLARLNTLRGVRELSKGRAQEAVDTWIAGIRFAQDLTKGGSLIFALTAKSVLISEMRTLTTETKQGHLGTAQKKQLSAAVSKLPEDGFDWGLAWEMDEAGTDVFFREIQRSPQPATLFERMTGQAAPKDCMPPSATQIKLYHEYMSDVASSLRMPTAAAKTRLAELVEKGEKQICETIRTAIPNSQRVNDARIEIIAARKDLLDALSR
jgi:hypothetical protein